MILNRFERMIAKRSVCRDNSGKCSPIWMPGVAVEIG